MIKKTPILVLGAFSLFAFVVSLILYHIVLPLLITALGILLLYVPFKTISEFKKKATFGSCFAYIIALILISSLIIVKLDPFLWNINREISKNLSQGPEVNEFIQTLNESTNELVPNDRSFIDSPLSNISERYVLEEDQMNFTWSLG